MRVKEKGIGIVPNNRGKEINLIKGDKNGIV